MGEEGDVLVGISTSGNSKNVINALKQAKYKNLKTISLTGKTGGYIDGIADIIIKVPSNNTQRIQESHNIMIGQNGSLLELSMLKNNARPPAGLFKYAPVEINSSPKTIEAYDSDIRRYLCFIRDSEGIESLDDVRPRNIRNYVNSH